MIILGTILWTCDTFCFLVCPKGYFGITCDIPCRFPSFGDYCQSKCYCDVDNCNHIMGCNSKPKWFFGTCTCTWTFLNNMEPRYIRNPKIFQCMAKNSFFPSREFTVYCTICMAKNSFFLSCEFTGFHTICMSRNRSFPSREFILHYSLIEILQKNCYI